MATYYIYKMFDAENTYNFVTKQPKWREARRVQLSSRKYVSMFGHEKVECICISSFNGTSLEDARTYLADYEKRVKTGEIIEPEEEYQSQIFPAYEKLIAERKAAQDAKRKARDCEWAREKIMCECGLPSTRGNISCHLKSPKHAQMMEIKKCKEECEECDTWSEMSDIRSEASTDTIKTATTEPIDDTVFFCCDCGVAVPPAYRELHLASAGHAMVQIFIKNREECLVE